MRVYSGNYKIPFVGIRPIVDKYSIARYSEGEWRGHNKKTLDGTLLELHRANLIDWNGRQCLQQTFADADKNQEDNTKRSVNKIVFVRKTSI